MAFPLGVEGLYQVTITHTYFGQSCQNKFWYQFTTGFSHSAENLATGFINTVLGILGTIRSDDITADILDVKNMGDGSDFYQVLTTAGAGDDIGTPQSPQDAWAFTLATANWLVGKGGKRFVGVTESQLDMGGVADSATEALLEAVADVLDSPFTVTGNIYRPVIVSPANTRHAGDIIEPIVTCLPNFAKSTQNSRKPF